MCVCDSVCLCVCVCACVKKPEHARFRLLTRSAYFAHSRLLKYTARVKQPGKYVSCFLTRTVYLRKLELAEIHGSGQKT